jgi:four helix bundle protein
MGSFSPDGCSKRGFPHNRLLAYVHAYRFHAFVVGAKSAFPRGLADLYDQLVRASSSVCLNIAEGASSFTPGTKVRAFRIALGSAGECDAILDLLELHLATDRSDLTAARRDLMAAAALTVGLIRRL